VRSITALAWCSKGVDPAHAGARGRKIEDRGVGAPQVEPLGGHVGNPRGATPQQPFIPPLLHHAFPQTVGGVDDDGFAWPHRPVVPRQRGRCCRSRREAADTVIGTTTRRSLHHFYRHDRSDAGQPGLATSVSRNLPTLGATSSGARGRRVHSGVSAAVATLSVFSAFAAAVQFARGFIGLKHPVFIVACSLSGLLLGIWIAHLVLAEVNASTAVKRSKSSVASVRPSSAASRGSRDKRIGTKLLLQLTIGLAAYLVSQLADRSGGAGPPLAAILIVVGITSSGLLGELVIRNRWRRTTLATLDAAMTTAAATYPRGASPAGAAAAGHGGQAAGWFASAATTVAGALVVALLLNAFSDRSGRLVSLDGTWAIGQLATKRQVNMADPASGLSSETWKITSLASCNEFRCGYVVKPTNGPRFVLHSTGKYTWTGARTRGAECTNEEPPYHVVVADGYQASERIKLSVDPGDYTSASIEDQATYTVNQAGKAHQCDRSGSATYAGSASLTQASGGSSVAGRGATSAGAAAQSATNTVTQPPPSDHGPQLSPQRRAADRTLHNFVEVQFNQPVGCTSTAAVPSGSTAQLACSLGGIGFVVTRLRSAGDTDAFLRMRYRQAYSFSGSAGKCSRPGTSIGTWYDGSGRLRGLWGVRQNRGHLEVLWGYDESSVAFVAAGPLGSALRVCNVWFDHSG
jgi:hypothetical protein